MRLEAIRVGKNPPDEVVIEISVGGPPIKYIRGNYGFVPDRLGDDGDTIDVIICNDRPLVPGCVINVRLSAC